MKNPSWTFFTNHTHILVCLQRQGDQPLRQVALTVGITERAVQKIVKELVEAGVLEITKEGRSNRYALHLDQPLRHPLEKHRTIGEILRLIG